MVKKFRPHPLIVLLGGVFLAACGSSGSDAPADTLSAPQPSMIAQPTNVNLYPSQSGTSAPLLRVMVTMVGGVTVNMPLGFDTGSAGVTLYAQSIFPASMVSASGFVFPAGQKLDQLQRHHGHQPPGDPQLRHGQSNRRERQPRIRRAHLRGC